MIITLLVTHHTIRMITAGAIPVACHKNPPRFNYTQSYDYSNCVMSDQQCVCGVGGWPVRVMFLSTIDNVYLEILNQ